MLRGYTVLVLPPTPKGLFFVFLGVSLLLFLRPPNTGFVFDEQEAILANPYLLGDGAFLEAFFVDFWGLPPDRSIGSYRPIPNLLWRSLAFSLRFQTPWALTFINLVAHALCATVLARVVARFVSTLAEREAQRVIWFSGLSFCVCALSAEAICSVVGLADLLAGLFTALALLLIVHAPASPPASARLAGLRFLRIAAVFICILLGLLSKESMMAALVILPIASLLRPIEDEAKPSNRVIEAALVTTACALALFFYVSLRNRAFPAPAQEAHALIISGPGAEILHSFFAWFAPPPIVGDPMNNPLILASPVQRLFAGAEIFSSQLLSFFFPIHLVADYSFPRQIPSASWVRVSLGILVFGASLLACFWGVLQRLRGQSLSPEKLLFFLGSGWAALSFLPLSNALVVLPTIRADRLFYTPSLGAAFLLASVAVALRSLSPVMRGRLAVFFLVFQSVQARGHALHYSNDVAFWRATSAGAPASAKAYLNYGVMVGARGDLNARLRYTQKAAEVAPNWPMAQVYLADTYCRRQEMTQAMPLYMKGLNRAANSKALTALALQCIWEAGVFDEYKHQFQDLAAGHAGSWFEYFVHELSQQEEGGEGVPLKYRPRRYNEARSGQK